jgi:hypothetical protein
VRLCHFDHPRPLLLVAQTDSAIRQGHFVPPRH